MGKILERHEVELCTRAAHEVNRTWNIAINEVVDKPYEQLTEAEKETGRAAVIAVATNDATAEQTHDAWLAKKKAEGWTYGVKKDAQLKTHPCLVPWAQLSMAQRAKDELWVTTVKSVLGHFWRIDQQ